MYSAIGNELSVRIYIRSEFMIIEKLKRLIEVNYRDEKATIFYSTALSLTIYRLNTLTKFHMGKSVIELIHEKVLMESKSALKHTLVPVKCIAMELGFTDSAYFIRFFKNRTGQTPKKYRRTQQSHRQVH